MMPGRAPRHFLELSDHTPAEIRALLDAAHEHKRRRRTRAPFETILANQVLGVVLERPSTRTRVAFDVAMRRLGGQIIVLSPRDMQLGRGETLADTARVLGRMLDAIVLRTDDANKLTELARHAGIPVINGLTPASHPCQILADLMTFEEHRGAIAGRTVAWCGDGNNVCASWIEAAALLGFALRIAAPDGHAPAARPLEWAHAQGADVTLLTDPREAVHNAACVVTDTWCSMSDDPSDHRRGDRLEPYRVDETLMAQAAPDALFMHCLPAHRGDEVTDAVIDGPHSVVFDEAENRIYAHQAILARVMAG